MFLSKKNADVDAAPEGEAHDEATAPGKPVGRCDVTFGSHLFSAIIGIAHNLLDLLNHSPRAHETTGDTVGESDQSQGTDDQTHEIVERK